MDKNKDKALRRQRRRMGIRKRVEGTPSRPRLAVYKSLKHMHAQLIDDLGGRTICSASTTESLEGLSKTGNSGAAAIVGKLLAERAVKAGVTEVAFDRGGFRFHGRVKALADAARKNGLKF
ncbi:MAG: 50S ribosomal protein L18 [Planctomycetota bacterium]|nr:50S ribosomal protein L18 [Planctomycetota bacterium]